MPAKVKEEKQKQKQKRRRAGGPLMGAFPDLDKRIMDLREHHVANERRYAVVEGRNFAFFKNLTAARVKVVTKGIGRPFKADDQKRALEAASPRVAAKATKELQDAARAAGFKLVKV